MPASCSFDRAAIWLLLPGTLLVVQMSSKAKTFPAVLYVLILTACASARPEVPPLQIDGMVILNQTETWISAVRVLLPATGGFVSCGNIAPGSMCSTGFPQTAYTGDPLEITWSQAGQIHSTGPFDMQIPDDVDAERAASVSVVIAAPGSAGAVIVQHQN